MFSLFLTTKRKHSLWTKMNIRGKILNSRAEKAIISCGPCAKMKKDRTQERALTCNRSYSDIIPAMCVSPLRAKSASLIANCGPPTDH